MIVMLQKCDNFVTKAQSLTRNGVLFDRDDRVGSFLTGCKPVVELNDALIKQQ
jgi:hypothetical protein